MANTNIGKNKNGITLDISTPKVPAINTPGTLHGTKVIPTVPVASTNHVIFLFFKPNFSNSGKNIEIGKIIAKS